jgi:hypothetical protein
MSLQLRQSIHHILLLDHLETIPTKITIVAMPELSLIYGHRGEAVFLFWRITTKHNKHSVIYAISVSMIKPFFIMINLALSVLHEHCKTLLLQLTIA